MYLGGPTAAAWVGLIGTFELRELRGRIPWYGTLVNHCAIVLPAIAGGFVASALLDEPREPLMTLLITLAAAAAYFALNALLASVTLALRSGQEVARVLLSDASEYFLTFLALAPLAWLVAEVYVMPGVGWWAVLLVVLPVYVIRLAMDRLVAMREMFTQTVASLAQAVDARDHFTSGHSRRVQEIAVEIGNVLRISDAELQALEWGGLLHDIGKIGVRDAVLLKADRLTKEERAQMNAHPVIGANIIAPVKGLAPELPIIRHHHEWFNGSGYPDRLIGEEIPRLARILHVADAFEAMTAARPYRMTPLTTEQAIAELRRFAGIQFDPVLVDAFVRTKYATGARDPGREPPVRVIPTIGQAAGRMAASGNPAPGSSPIDAS
jgi:HD-GYP domain-containing protein (c-di-GMP phosphodiesterase class II)